MKTLRTILVALAALQLPQAAQSQPLSQSQSQPQREPNSLRVMSYNVHNCVGMDDKRDFERVAAVIRQCAPDVAALQELDSMTIRHRRDVPGELARRTGMYVTYAPSIKIMRGRYGVAMLSREKPIAVRRVPLPGKEEKRVALVVEFERYVAVCTHMSLTEADRLTSARILAGEARRFDKPVLLAGDMNDFPDSEFVKVMSEHFRMLNDPRQGTYPADGESRRCIDYVFGRGGMAVLGSRVVPERMASDHLPLYVDVRLAAPEEAIMRTAPWLQNPAGGGVTVTWATGVPTHSRVEYSADGREWRRAQTLVDGQAAVGTIHRVRLDSLEPGVRYRYRVVSREVTHYGAYGKQFGATATSREYSFRLPAGDERDFTALVLNDLHKNKALVDTLARAVRDVDYDFAVLDGDIVDDPRGEAEAVDFLGYLTAKIDAAQRPVVMLRGNHEIRGAYSVRLRDLVEYPGGRTYGAFNWGDTRFVTLDCGEDKPDSTAVYYGMNDFTALRREQVDFLRGELASDAFAAAGRRVLIHHIPVYGLSGDENGRFNPCLALWGPLLATAPFDVSINGHTHRRAYHPRGTVGNNFPVVVGGGSNVRSGTAMILTRTGDELRLKMLGTDGATLHDIEL